MASALSRPDRPLMPMSGRPGPSYFGERRAGLFPSAGVAQLHNEWPGLPTAGVSTDQSPFCGIGRDRSMSALGDSGWLIKVSMSSSFEALIPSSGLSSRVDSSRLRTNVPIE